MPNKVVVAVWLTELLSRSPSRRTKWAVEDAMARVRNTRNVGSAFVELPLAGIAGLHVEACACRQSRVRLQARAARRQRTH